ncbi:uncharacterized protein F21D5.5 [Scaptodrosophila lebanonensis]|uniref:Uncharacterized protein F21D5.5 n=1 Tax=Drosophila lebanonensis TaxID=7225 RepID=A0A6J2T2N2_DROLE|nr:uncharacterized protein F21D5.5 [Scaptodrosophila lebanonensis]
MSLVKYLNRSVGETSKKVVGRVCTLKPIEAEHCTIRLNDGLNVIGRSKDTGIRDARCSKQQLQLKVDFASSTISMKVLGLNPSSVNGLMVMQHTECELQHGDILEIVYNRHPYEVVFNPPPVNIEATGVDQAANVRGCSDVEKWDSAASGKLVIYTSAGVAPSDKIAGYDMDGTIIKTLSGNVFPKNTDDWQIIFPEVPQKLQRLYRDGFKICFFTNQGGIARGKIKLDDFKVKIKLIAKKLGVPVQVFIAVGDGYYRKPLPGMWEHLVEEMNDGVPIKLERSFFVGDAAGRPETGKGATKQRKDHSLADRLFAHNIGITFYTPEVHFLGKRIEQWDKPDFDPSSVHDQVPQFEPDDVEFTTDKCEMIIMVGLPGSGKSHFCETFLVSRGYKIANADTLGSTQACLKACRRFLEAGQSCVVDNTNVDAASRQKFLQLAAEMKIECRCFVMNLTVSQAKHNIVFRELSDTSHSKINDMVFNMMKKKYKTPTLEEGFSKIYKINFVPKFASDKDMRLYKMYLLEK